MAHGKAQTAATIETARLRLRRFRPTDWQDIYEYLSDEDVMRYESFPVQSAAGCREIAADRSTRCDSWAMCVKESGKVIGHIYLPEREQHTWELGYGMNRAFWGRGYATEAAGAALRHVFADCGAHRVMAMCNPENEPSWRLLERLHMRREAHHRQNIFFVTDACSVPEWIDTYVYAVLRDEWRQHVCVR